MAPSLEAFEDLLDAQEEHAGSRITATIGEVTAKDCLVSAIDADLIAISGGSGEQGGFSLQMRASDFGNEQPAKFSAVEITGRSEVNLCVLRVSESHGIYTLTVGDPAANG